MTNARDEQIIAGLLHSRECGKWSEEAARLGVRADFRCEYCSHDLLASAEAYRQWHVDHIVPINSGGTDEYDNKAISCKSCNFDWKGKWDPRTRVGAAARVELLSAVRTYIAEKKQKKDDELRAIREIVGRRCVR